MDECSVPSVYYKKELIYPDDFFDFSNGKPIEEQEVQNWINECVWNMKLDDTQDFSFQQSGNTFVCVLRIGDEIKVIVSDKYKEFEVLKNDLSPQKKKNE